MVTTPTFANAQKVQQPDMATLVSAVRAWASVFPDLLLASLNAVVPGGFALSAVSGTPIQVNYAAGKCVISGYEGVVSGGTLTLSPADGTNHRYDLLTVAYSQEAGSITGGGADLVDTFTPTVVTGTPSGSPVLPALPSTSVQIGWVDVPPTVTSATACVLHSGTANQGPLVPNNLQDLTNHLAASLLSGVVHGVQATTAGGTQHSRLALTDTVNGAVGAANLLVDAGGTSRQLATPGSNGGGNTAASYDASGRVYDSERAGGWMVDRGSFSFTNTGSGSFAVTYAVNFQGRTPTPNWTYSGSGGPSSYQVSNVTPTGFTATWEGGGGGACVGYWSAIG